jgi:hypothetical protein
VIARAACFVIATILLAGAHDPEIGYFTNVRDVQISAPDKQNYFVVDRELWGHSRSDLADMRLYDGLTQVPYILIEEKPRTATVERNAKLLNLGTVGDHTEFDLDTEGIPQYDRVRLQIDARDFVSSALLFGEESLNGKSRTQLGLSTLYDFSRERLGSNFVLQLPTSTFRYLHVRLSPGIRPEQVKGAALFEVRDKQASWTNAGSCREPEQRAKNTIITCLLAAGVPLERIGFESSPEQVNFRRNVSVSAGEVQIANGDVSRVRINRAGTQITSEHNFVDVPGVTEKREITLTIANGDDSPLNLISVEPLALERRIYFDASGKRALKLYYGDDKLQAPVYDYAKFFNEDPAAAQAQLGPGLHNAEYTGRPDERPWSERHKALLWAAMVLAVVVLAVVALRGLAIKPGS